MSGGEGANFDATDFGQFGNPVNPCSDPANEGGALRSQDLRSTADPTGLNGAILRLDPATGAALPTNPNFGSSDANARRIIAYGLRNPFRFTFRPGTSEIWAGDVGWNTWEEIDRVTNPTGPLTNFGWPCYEGNAAQSGYQSANLPLCQSLYSGAGQTAPYYTYNHGSRVHLNIGPGGELYYADLGGGTVRRIRYFPNNRPTRSAPPVRRPSPSRPAPAGRRPSSTPRRPRSPGRSATRSTSPGTPPTRRTAPCRRPR